MKKGLPMFLSVIIILCLTTSAWCFWWQTTPPPTSTWVTPEEDVFQVRYASNLAIGESVINITNAGTSGGNICVNVYTFSADEQEVSCCSCLVTPNGLVNLGVVRDLISNTLTPAVPTSVTVKLLASTPPGGATGRSCTNSAANPGVLVGGMRAWGTTIHAAPAGGYAVTETPFSKADLSEAELSRITDLCENIIANGSGYGICRSCQAGGK